MILNKFILESKERDYEVGICINKLENENQYELLEYCLNESEAEHYKKIKMKSRRNSFLLGRYVAKVALSNLIDTKIRDISIRSGIFNFPIIEACSNKKYNVSLSHCKNIGAAIAFEEDLIMGIDIEEIRDGFEAILCNYLVEQEKLIINQNIKLEKGISTIIWTAKEALGKALKTGLTVPSKILEVKEVIFKDTYLLCTFTNFPQYKSVSMTANKHACSIVMPKQLEMDINIVKIKSFFK